ncbi:MAG: hypothetical protein ACYDCO_20910 [Armatimonadota bacterium]
MQHQFSLLAFLAKVPLGLLETYFTEVGLGQTELGACIPWDALAYDRENFRRGLAIIRQAITAADTPLRERILQDFMDVNDLADEGGLTALAMSARLRPQPVELWDALFCYEGSHAKALAALCEWPEIFHNALRHRRVEAIAEHRWVKTGRIEEALPDFSPAAQTQLAEVIGQHYHQLGHGRGCVVEVEPRGDGVYTFVYPEDYARRRLAFDAQHQLIVETTRPAFEVIFAWQTATQTLEYFSPGNKLERQQVLTAFGRVMLGVELCPDQRRPSIFHLDPLTSPGFDFALRPEDRVDAVLLKEIWLRKKDDLDGRFFHYGSKLTTDPLSCYQAMEDGLNEERVPLDQLEVYRVQLRLHFRGRQTGSRQILRTITLSHPDLCTLKRTDPYYQVIMEILRRCGIDRSASVMEPTWRWGAA